MARKNLSHRVLVIVDREMTTKTPTIVWEHEMPILEAIFGEGNIKPVDPKTMDDGFSERATPDMLIHNKRQDAFQRPSESVGIGNVFAGNPEAEYNRLGSVYGKAADVDMLVVERVYGRFSTGMFSRMVGDAGFEDMPSAQLRDLIMRHGYLPQLDVDATAAERAAADEQRRALFSLTQSELVKLAEEVAGVPA